MYSLDTVISFLKIYLHEKDSQKFKSSNTPMLISVLFILIIIKRKA